MYASLRNWMNLPAQIKPFIKRTGSGIKEYAEPVSILCYAEGKVQVVTNNTGAEIVSSKQLYIDGSTIIKELDAVIFEGAERSIKSLGTFYRAGAPDIKVVYL